MPHELPLRVLDGVALRRWAFRARGALGEYRQRLDGLNVFPVPDGDTGTNLTMSLHGALETLVREATPDGPSGLAGGASDLGHTLLLSARGNSGVILGLLVRGLAEVFEEWAIEATEATEATGTAETATFATDPVDATPATPATPAATPAGAGAAVVVGAARRETVETVRPRDPADPRVDAVTLAAALTRAAQRAWEGVDDPVEGTILSVARAAAEAATRCAESGGDLAATVEAADAAARRSLAMTPEQLRSLANAGVVDAGGAGLAIVLAALREIVTGEPVSVELPRGAALEASAWGGSTSGHPGGAGTGGDGAVASGAYEVMYVLEGCAADDAVGLRRRLADLGDSLVMAGDDTLRTVHVHTDDPGAAIEVALPTGEVHGIRITWLGDAATHAHPIGPRAWPDTPDVGAAAPRLGIVACADGAGLAAALRQAGAVVVPDGPGRRATPRDVLDAARATRASDVVVFPGDPDARLAATTAARLAATAPAGAGAGARVGPRVHVVATRSPVQTLAALSLHDPLLEAEAMLTRFADAVAAVRVGGVVRASRAALTAAGPCEPGDVLGVVGDDVVHFGGNGNDVVDVGVAVVEALLAGAGAEVLTVVTGAESGDTGEVGATVDSGDSGDRVAQRCERAHPGLEVQVVAGGQSVYALLIGVE